MISNESKQVQIADPEHCDQDVESQEQNED